MVHWRRRIRRGTVRWTVWTANAVDLGASQELTGSPKPNRAKARLIGLDGLLERWWDGVAQKAQSMLGDKLNRTATASRTKARIGRDPLHTVDYRSSMDAAEK